MFLMTELFLVVPKNEIAGFTMTADREYFSKPVRVVIVDKGDGKICRVADPIRGHTYPAYRTKLKQGCQLTNKQMAAAKAAIEAAEQAKQPEGGK